MPVSPTKSGFTEGVALVEAPLEPVPLVAGHGGRGRSVVVVLAEVDRRDVVDVLVLVSLRPALTAADRAEADQVVAGRWT